MLSDFCLWQYIPRQSGAELNCLQSPQRPSRRPAGIPVRIKAAFRPVRSGRNTGQPLPDRHTSLLGLAQPACGCPRPLHK